MFFFIHRKTRTTSTPEEYWHGHQQTCNANVRRLSFSDASQLPEDSQHSKIWNVYRWRGKFRFRKNTHPVLFRSMIDGKSERKYAQVQISSRMTDSRLWKLKIALMLINSRFVPMFCWRWRVGVLFSGTCDCATKINNSSLTCEANSLRKLYRRFYN